MARIARVSLERPAFGLRAKLALLLLSVAAWTPCGAHAQDFAPDHSLIFAITPDLPGVIEVRPASDEVTAVRALFVVDGKLHRVPLFRSSDGAFRGSFPTPWKRVEYRIQYATSNSGIQLSPNYVADQSCRNSSLLAERSKTEKFAPAREALLKEAILLDDDIRRLNYVEQLITAIQKREVSSEAR